MDVLLPLNSVTNNEMERKAFLEGLQKKLKTSPLATEHQVGHSGCPPMPSVVVPSENNLITNFSDTFCWGECLAEEDYTTFF
jgi:hypothetical protein